MVIEKILGKAEDFDLTSLSVERVFFGHDSLQRGHQRVKTESGRELFISIEHGKTLFCGAVLYKDDELAVLADMIDEDVIEIKPRDNIEWAKTAYNIGNMHSPAYFSEDCILVPYDESLERLSETLCVPWKRCMRKLNGQRAGVSTHRGSHSHGR